MREDLLEPPLEADQPAPRPAHLVYDKQNRLPLKLRAFVDFVVPRLRDRLTAVALCFGRAIAHAAGLTASRLSHRQPPITPPASPNRLSAADRRSRPLPRLRRDERGLASAFASSA